MIDEGRKTENVRMSTLFKYTNNINQSKKWKVEHSATFGQNKKQRKGVRVFTLLMKARVSIDFKTSNNYHIYWESENQPRFWINENFIIFSNYS